MKHLQPIRPAKALIAGFNLFVAAVICVATATAYCQVAPSGNARPDDQTALDQASLDAAPSQTADTANLNSLNENASSLQYTDSALTRIPFFFGVQTAGTWTSNLFNTLDNAKPESGTFFDVAVPVGVHLSSQTTNFGANFREDTAFYPSYSNLNHTSETYTQQLDHQLSERTKTSWSLAGGHVVTLGNYLSPVIGAGTGGVVFTPRSGGLEPLNDAATSYAITHQLSERNSIIASATAGWLNQSVSGQPVKGQPSSYEQATGVGDMQWQHALNNRGIVGIDLTDAYIKGFSPVEDSNFTSAKLTLSQTVIPHVTATAGAGPLFVTSTQSGSSAVNTLSYAANAGIEYQTTYAHITGGYSRLYQAGYFAAANIANEIYFRFDRPLTRRLYFTLDSQLMKITTPTKATNAEDYAQVGFSGRLETHLTPALVFYVSGSAFSQGSVTTDAGRSPGYRYSEVTSGFTCYFGNPFSRPSGVQ